MENLEYKLNWNDVVEYIPSKAFSGDVYSLEKEYIKVGLELIPKEAGTVGFGVVMHIINDRYYYILTNAGNVMMFTLKEVTEYYLTRGVITNVELRCKLFAQRQLEALDVINDLKSRDSGGNVDE